LITQFNNAEIRGSHRTLMETMDLDYIRKGIDLVEDVRNTRATETTRHVSSEASHPELAREAAMPRWICLTRKRNMYLCSLRHCRELRLTIAVSFSSYC
jgi:hypothetical protein